MQTVAFIDFTFSLFIIDGSENKMGKRSVIDDREYLKVEEGCQRMDRMMKKLDYITKTAKCFISSASNRKSAQATRNLRIRKLQKV